MLSFQDYLAYWPVLAGALVFFALGLWMYLSSEAAMERSAKPVHWVADYRKPGFPFRRERLPWTEPLWLIPALLALVGGGVRYALGLNAGQIVYRQWLPLYGPTYNLLTALIGAGGAFAAYLLLLILFRSRFAALLGTLLFLIAPVHGHNTVSLLTVSTLFLLLYLRSERAGFRAELWYYGACLFFALAIAIDAELLWLVPLLMAFHLYRLYWNLRHNRIGWGNLCLFAAAALGVWLLIGAVTGVTYRCVHNRFQVLPFAELFNPLRIRYACSELLRDAGLRAFRPIMRNRLLEPLLDAPLLGLGFWGLFSLGGMAFKRRQIQGWFVLGMTALFTLVWLLSGTYLLTLPLTLAVGATARNAELGGKRITLLVVVLAGVLFSIGLALSAWALPLVSPLAWRLL